MANTPEKVLENCIANLSFHSKVLVVGGGADNTVVELIRNQTCEEITHVDISKVLSVKGRSRLQKQFPHIENKIEFIVKAFLDFESNVRFDAIIFPFYLDLFHDSEILENLAKANSILGAKGSVIAIDFCSSGTKTKWQSTKEWGLYFLFQPFTKVNRRKFPELEDLFTQSGFAQTQFESYENGFYCKREFVLQQVR